MLLCTQRSEWTLSFLYFFWVEFVMAFNGAIDAPFGRAALRWVGRRGHSTILKSKIFAFYVSLSSRFSEFRTSLWQSRDLVSHACHAIKVPLTWYQVLVIVPNVRGDVSTLNSTNLLIGTSQRTRLRLEGRMVLWAFSMWQIFVISSWIVGNASYDGHYWQLYWIL